MSRHSFSFAVLLLLSSSALALADPPARIGRLSYLQGTVSFHTADQDQWALAQLNYPVTDGNALWTEPGARSEIQVGPMEIRMDASTELDITRLDAAATQISVPQGVINIHLRTNPVAPMQVMTPAGEVDLAQAGSYHIDAGHGDPQAPNQTPVQVTVLEGQAEANSLHAAVPVLPGETALVAGNPPSVTLQEGNATPFDNWALSREKREVALQAPHYISPQATGYQDLDEYGQWSQAPSVGAVWYPAGVPAEWAPYRYGHWAFIQPWGWTWVDDAPWGFTPFHYGRWAQIENRWAWCPGEPVAQPVYAPALVAFIGGSNWGVSISGGQARPAVGWVPLAPSEPFHPYYAASENYTRAINGNNGSNVAAVQNATITRFANRRAATIIPVGTFAQGAPVHRAVMAVPPGQLASAPVTPALVHIQPTALARAGGMPMVHEQVAHPPVSLAPAPVRNEHVAVQPVQDSAITHPAAPAAAPAVKQATPEPEIVRPETANPAVMDHAERHAPPAVEEKTATVIHAPEPAVHHPAVQPEQYRAVTPAHAPSAAQPAKAQIAHPEQHTRIAPTPQGWVRAPREELHPPKAAPHPPQTPHESDENKHPPHE